MIQTDHSFQSLRYLLHGMPWHPRRQ